MSQINDLKSTSLTDLGYTGTFNDKEYAWLGDQGCTVNQYNNRWLCYLRAQGYTGTLNDMLYRWLLGKGYTGSLMDMIKQALEDGNFYSGSGPLFYAATYDRDTYELMVQLIGEGTPTSTHTADIYAPDYLGIYRKFGADEPVWNGVRWVENLLTYSEDFSNAAWAVGSGAVKVGVVSGVGPNGEDAYEVSFDGTAGGRLFQNLASVIGEQKSIRLTVRAKTGTVNARTIIDNNKNSNLVALTTSWVTIGAFDGVTVGGNVRYGLRVDDAASVYILNAQVEDITAEVNAGVIDPPPSEYIPTEATAVTKVFANENGNTVTNNVVTEAVGAPLPGQPYLVSQPAATNLITSSSDLTGWSAIGPPIVSYDQVGITGVPNTATYLEDDDVAASDYVSSNLPAISNGDSVAIKMWVKKQASSTDHTVRIRSYISGGTALNYNIYFDAYTGTVRSSTFDDEEVIDDGDWWVIVGESTDTNNNNTSARVYIYPAGSDGAGTGPVASAVGSCIVGNVEIHLNKTITEVRGLGPVFTEGTAVSTDAVNPTYDAGNHDNLEGGYYTEIRYTGDDTDILTVDGNLLRIGDGDVGNPELVTNGGFDTDIAGWVDLNATSAWNSELQAIDITASGNAEGTYHTFTAEIGKTYIARGESLVANTNHLLRVSSTGIPNAGIGDSVERDSPGVHSIVFTAVTETMSIYMRCSEAGEVTWDNISVSEAGKTLQLTDDAGNLAEMEVQQPTGDFIEYKVGCAYGDSKMDLNLNGVWAGEVTYDGSFGTGAIIQGETTREIKRIDASYDQSKIWVNGEMT